MTFCERSFLPDVIKSIFFNAAGKCVYYRFLPSYIQLKFSPFESVEFFRSVDWKSFFSVILIMRHDFFHNKLQLTSYVGFFFLKRRESFAGLFFFRTCMRRQRAELEENLTGERVSSIMTIYMTCMLEICTGTFFRQRGGQGG